MKRVVAAAFVTCVLAACNGQFRFDELPADAGIDASTPVTVDASTDVTVSNAGVCAQESDCARYGLHCDDSLGRCVACVDDVQCPTDHPRCDTALHRCVECGANADCGANGRCDSRTHRCYATCSILAPSCPAGFECDEDDFRCQRCEHDDRCAESEPAAPHCDPQLRVCVACTLDTHCTGTARHCDRTQGRCVECLGPAQCPAERPVCLVDGRCAAG